jgi:hypothetical protein
MDPRALICSLLVGSALLACAAAPADAPLAEVTRAALADAARRTGLAPAALQVASAERVTWGDGSLGCPQPDRMYTQALVPGYRVRIRAGGEVLDYHASMAGVPALCPGGRAVEPPRGVER